jgi:hypothetical protein
MKAGSRAPVRSTGAAADPSLLRQLASKDSMRLEDSATAVLSYCVSDNDLRDVRKLVRRDWRLVETLFLDHNKISSVSMVCIRLIVGVA